MSDQSGGSVGAAGTALERDLVEALGRDVVRLGWPGELEFFDDAASEVRGVSTRSGAGAVVRPPVGLGIDFAQMAPYALAAAAWLVTVVASDVASTARDAISSSARSALARLLGIAPDTAAAPAGDGAAPIAPPALTARPGCTRPAGALVCLEPVHEREVYTAVAARAEGDGLTPVQARDLAESVIGALRLRAGCCQ